MSEARCVQWEHTMQVMELSRDVKESSEYVDGWVGPPYTTRYTVVRVRVEGSNGVRGEILVANHDAPQIGDLFKVTFERHTP